VTTLEVTQWLIYAVISGGGMVLAIHLVGFNKCVNPRFFAFPFLFFMGMTYVIRPPLIYVFGEGYEYSAIYDIPIERLPLVAVIVAVSFLSFSLGYRLFTPRSYLRARTWAPLKSTALSLFGFLMVAVGYVALYTRGGGTLGNTAVIETMAGGTINRAGTSFIDLASLFIPSGLTLLFAGRLSPWLLGLLSVPFVVSSVFAGYNRYIFLLYLVSIAVIAIIRHPRFEITKRLGVLILVGAAFFLFALVGANRVMFVETGSLKESYSSLKIGGVNRLLGDFAGFEGTIYAINRREESPVSYGARNFYNIFILPIPRLLWPNKPLPPEFSWRYLYAGEALEGYRTTEYMLFYNTQVRGHIGYALEDWGWGGAFVTFFLTGLIYGWVEKKFWLSNGNPCALAAYAVFYGLLLYSGRNSITDNLVRFIIYFFVPYYIIWKLLPAVHFTAVGLRQMVVPDEVQDPANVRKSLNARTGTS
jgi:hypothetical protein